MAVADNVVLNIASSIQNSESLVVLSESNVPNDTENKKPMNDSAILTGESRIFRERLTSLIKHYHDWLTISVLTNNYKVQIGRVQNGFEANGDKNQHMMVNFRGGYGINHMTNGVINGENGGESFKRDTRDLEELLSKLNPMAKEFVPPSLSNIHHGYFGDGGFGYANNFTGLTDTGNANGHNNKRKKNGYSQGR